MIVFNNVAKSFDAGRSWAVREVSLTVADGETLVLLGASGSGKTTLLRIANRLIELDAGAVEIDGGPLAAHDPVLLRRRIGYVFQGIGLFPHLSAAENVAIVPRLTGRPAAWRTARAHELLELMGLDPTLYAGRYPDELSGGQRQRVAVARALAADPPYLFMDEPFGALDALTRDALQQELAAIKRRLGKTILFVTHDIFEAFALGDRVAVMNGGRLEQTGTPHQLVHAPATDFVRELLARPRRQLADFRDLL